MASSGHQCSRGLLSNGSLTISSFALGGGGRGGGRGGALGSFASLLWSGAGLAPSGDCASRRGSGRVTSDTSTATLSAQRGSHIVGHEGIANGT